MIRSAVTVSLVEEAKGGPFVFWDGILDACQRAAALGFDAIEIFAPAHDTVDRDELRKLLEEHKLAVAAVGTGAGMVKHGLNLTDPDGGQRTKAKDFIKQMIDFGGEFAAPAIIGSMQGRWGGDVSKEAALDLLGEAVRELGEYAAQYNVPLIYEPLNRYETNLVNTVDDGVAFLKKYSADNAKLLADLFHMNIEEANLVDAIRAGEGYIGHIHFVDSNRHPTGGGHMLYDPIATAIQTIKYDGYLSAEAFPLPDPQTAAEATIEMFNRYFR